MESSHPTMRLYSRHGATLQVGQVHYTWGYTPGMGLYSRWVRTVPVFHSQTSMYIVYVHVQCISCVCAGAVDVGTCTLNFHLCVATVFILPPPFSPSLRSALHPSLPPSISPSLPPSLAHSLPPSLPPSLPSSLPPSLPLSCGIDTPSYSK